jgi:hypothetical protein
LAWPDVSPSRSQAVRPWLWWVSAISASKQSTGKMFVAVGICGLGNCSGPLPLIADRHFMAPHSSICTFPSLPFCSSTCIVAYSSSIYDDHAPNARCPFLPQHSQHPHSRFPSFGRIAQATLKCLISFGLIHCIYTSNLSSPHNTVLEESLTAQHNLCSVQHAKLDQLARGSDMLFVLVPGGEDMRRGGNTLSMQIFTAR